MRCPVRINLELIEKWLSEVEISSERQNDFVVSVRKIVADAREKNDVDIVLDVDDDIVLCRYKNGKEVTDTAEAPLYYAQSIALGNCDWDGWR